MDGIAPLHFPAEDIFGVRKRHAVRRWAREDMAILKGRLNGPSEVRCWSHGELSGSDRQSSPEFSHGAAQAEPVSVGPLFEKV